MSALAKCEACGKEIPASDVANSILISELARYRKALWEVKNDLLHLPADPRITRIIQEIQGVLRG